MFTIKAMLFAIWWAIMCQFAEPGRESMIMWILSAIFMGIALWGNMVYRAMMGDDDE